MRIIYPAQCSCRQVFLEKYQFAKPDKNGNVGFCWCGWCRTKTWVKPMTSIVSPAIPVVEDVDLDVHWPQG